MLGRYGMKPRTTHLSSPHENGDVESSNGGLKRAIDQVLHLRGSRDFTDRGDYEIFLHQILRGRNEGRATRLSEDLAAMPALTMACQPIVREERAKVSRAGTIRVQKKAYSVPSSLVGQEVQVWLTEWEIEVRYAGKVVRRMPRLVGEPYDVDYRHVVMSLLRKPGGFRQYRYRDALFPRAIFTWAWEDLCQRKPSRQADLQYLRILKLAGMTIETDVAAELQRLRDAGNTDWDAETLQTCLAPPAAKPPEIERAPADLACYDKLLSQAFAAEARQSEVLDVAAD
jgi:hypothetical protein